VEGYPGVIESTNIDPLNPDSNKGKFTCLMSDDLEQSGSSEHMQMTASQMLAAEAQVLV
jgi:hypothetical protein